jgi:copper(I)-binding protein
MRIVLVAAALAMFAAGAVHAADYRAGPIEIRSPWTRATPRGAPVAVGYVVLHNRGSAGDRLIGASFAGASSVELHRMSMEDGVMRMRPVAGGVEIKPGQTVEFKPNGLHLMFVGLKQALETGQRIKATLVFQTAGTAEVEFAVEGMGGPASGHGH